MLTFKLHNTGSKINPAWTYWIFRDGKAIWQPSKLWRYENDAKRTAKRYCDTH